VQEALTNVARHAGATQVTISLEQADRHWILEIRDDGLGFDATATRTRRHNRRPSSFSRMRRYRICWSTF